MTTTITKSQLSKLIQEAIKEQMSSDSSVDIDPVVLRNVAHRANFIGNDLQQMANYIQNFNKLEKREVIDLLTSTIASLNRLSNMLEEIHDKVQGQ